MRQSSRRPSCTVMMACSCACSLSIGAELAPTWLALDPPIEMTHDAGFVALCTPPAAPSISVAPIRST